jgi:hypothetical protein
LIPNVAKFKNHGFLGGRARATVTRQIGKILAFLIVLALAHPVVPKANIGTARLAFRAAVLVHPANTGIIRPAGVRVIVRHRAAARASAALTLLKPVARLIHLVFGIRRTVHPHIVQ